MKYVQINATATAWAESIILGKHRELLEAGHDPYFFWGRRGGDEDGRRRRFATDLDNYTDALLTRLDGKPCFHSKRATARLLGWFDEINPDVVHLHNLLGYYINIEMLFDWLARHDCKVLWTLHDCWAFTGHCIHFTYVGCSQWKTCCGSEASCPQPGTYPQTFRRNIETWNYKRKQQLFTMLPPERLSFITPSQWLADLVGESFLAGYSVEVRHNVVDKTVFKPTPSNFRECYGLEGKYVILGVASKWSKRKGLDIFARLAKELDDSYAVVLVGLSKRQVRVIGNDVIALPRTDTLQELAEAYTAADLLVQPSVEETFGMTVAEAQACGTCVLVVEGSACVEASAGGDAIVAKPGFMDIKQAIVESEAFTRKPRVTAQ